MSSAQQQAQQQQKATEDKKNLPQLGALEEDDEFEEFAAEDWGEYEEDPADAHFWEDNWDDDDIEDDFSKQLRAELEKDTSQPQPMKM
ncbi:26S proteasome complex subunit DSS1 [Mycotypha africana]|uniref:26S proteasome complex subunit DSS1 n=1 Tax=Mycotypha africana TaxID=64632 RepID=UPI002301DE34|nr:26S proteasome complex subunit DSS1 [Mycotypha africana]KAI8984164.1 26S proteasome complex subunit DSS1 [Mycotypha africana]